MLLYQKLSDKELITALKNGEQMALKQIIERYWQRLIAVAMNRLNVLEEAEECVQDVFYNLWKKRETIELKYTLGTYLSVAIKYQVLNLLDKKYRRIKTTDVSEDTIENAVGYMDDHLLEKELFRQLESTIKQLPEKCQIVYRLSREGGKTNKQIATELHISEKTVEAHLTKALKDIRGQLTLNNLLFLILLLNHLQRKL
ncbi:RNA polymerase sigma-70 factor [Pedobacter nutrimenti]|uniref:RNA polymerase sigma-70 factor n=1 Tax=Pedobacter nutrimenti TaxID=1241337 RepID=UPI0029316E2A|nr:RNA polymerase sigma-70 factor [Pedobacter nutrimenti]